MPALQDMQTEQDSIEEATPEQQLDAEENRLSNADLRLP
jgi:hypothetical protein